MYMYIVEYRHVGENWSYEPFVFDNIEMAKEWIKESFEPFEYKNECYQCIVNRNERMELRIKELTKM